MGRRIGSEFYHPTFVINDVEVLTELIWKERQSNPMVREKYDPTLYKMYKWLSKYYFDENELVEAKTIMDRMDELMSPQYLRQLNTTMAEEAAEAELKLAEKREKENEAH